VYIALLTKSIQRLINTRHGQGYAPSTPPSNMKKPL
jgi:hypothetical protein